MRMLLENSNSIFYYNVDRVEIWIFLVAEGNAKNVRQFLADYFCEEGS